MHRTKELPQRQATRLQNYDYGSCGAYFVTICTQSRKSILSAIVGEGSPLPQLSPYGKIADEWIKKLPDKYPKMSVDCYVIMPNHIHLLISVNQDDGRGNPSPTLNEVMGWLKYQMTKEINAAAGKSCEKIFQRSFFDHIIRNQADYLETYRYILENPLKWQLDELYSTN